ncbi:MAG: PD40 domain-containing protein [Gemmatimonadetes bacterium]|nr:PD40 domain-containing protein [Gemmatimonadota bacterium]
MRLARGLFPWLSLAVALTALLLSPLPVGAQYFGRNKVRYDDFDFRVLRTSHFDIHFYPEAADAVRDAARMSERWYERLARTFQHEFKDSKPLVLYADHPDFEQTNTLDELIDESTGGVTESLKNRVILPLTGSYQDTDHVLGHELVHAFQYDVAQSGDGRGMAAMSQLPLWFVEGMAEYLSVGRESPLTAMWLRDAVRRNDLPTLARLSRDLRYFPYRFGQAVWAYVGGTYGDDAVVRLYRRALQEGWEPAVVEVLGMKSDSLSALWKAAVETAYRPLMEGRASPADVGRLLLGPTTGAGRSNLAPSVSPDGRYLAFLSEKDLFTIDLYLADARTGKVMRKLAGTSSDPHFDALRYLDSSGSWSPDGKQLAFVVVADGDNQLAVLDVESGKLERKLPVAEVGAIANPAWSPDGRTIAFSGARGGISDLYVLDLATGEVRQLMHDRYADFQPAWSPDGRTIAFVSDRGPETDFLRLAHSRFQIALLDVASGAVRALPLFGNVNHVNPQFSPAGDALYFLSDQDGFNDIYRVSLDGKQLARITRVATGVSGITHLSPAFSLAREMPLLVLSVFDERGFNIHAIDGEPAGTPVERTFVAMAAGGAVGPDGAASAAAFAPAPGRMLPPAVPPVESRVAAYLADAETGLAGDTAYPVEKAANYAAGLSLDHVSTLGIGIAADAFGTYFGGEISGYFSDMLGDRFLGAALVANGGVKDIGGQLFYVNRNHRLTWGLGVQRIPYVYGYQATGIGQGGTLVTQQVRYRTYIDEASGLVAYPLSTTRRLEAGLGLTRYSFDIEVRELVSDRSGRVVDRSTQHLDTSDPLNLAHGSIAFVGDRSFSAFTSPVSGERYRFELEAVAGTIDYLGLLADYRRYVRPASPLTLAFRAMHYGRFGNLAGLEQRGIQPLFLGYETLIRGYAYESFEANECTASPAGTTSVTGCAGLDRLFGQRLAVANFELRIPLTGNERYGLLPFRFLPIELAAFADGGLAWDSEREPNLAFSTSSSDRVPVFSTGLSARLNLLGFLVLEAYYAYPFQRPEKGWHWGFNIAPGW